MIGFGLERREFVCQQAQGRQSVMEIFHSFVCLPVLLDSYRFRLDIHAPVLKGKEMQPFVVACRHASAPP